MGRAKGACPPCSTLPSRLRAALHVPLPASQNQHLLECIFVYIWKLNGRDRVYRYDGPRRALRCRLQLIPTAHNRSAAATAATEALFHRRPPAAGRAGLYPCYPPGLRCALRNEVRARFAAAPVQRSPRRRARGRAHLDPGGPACPTAHEIIFNGLAEQLTVAASSEPARIGPAPNRATPLASRLMHSLLGLHFGFGPVRCSNASVERPYSPR